MIDHHTQYGRPLRRSPRRGIVLIVILATASICLVLFGLWVKNLVREHGRSVGRQQRVQATRLAEAGLRRAIARRSAEPQFQQEVWNVPAEQLGGRHAGVVELRVKNSENGKADRYEATARYPAEAARRAQVTKHIELPASPTEGES
jgi:hypothetical protein